MSAAHFCLTAQDGRPVLRTSPIPGGCAHCMKSAWRLWPSVIATHVGWPPLTTALDVTEEAITHFTFPLPPFGRTPCCSAPHRLLHQPPLPVADDPPRAIRPGQKKHLVTAPLLHQELARSTG
jgi:hypothetical protein